MGIEYVNIRLQASGPVYIISFIFLSFFSKTVDSYEVEI